MVISHVESLHRTIAVPAIIELDGLSSKAAIEFVASHVRSHPDALKAQTSRGTYLSSLSVRIEQVDFDDVVTEYGRI